MMIEYEVVDVIKALLKKWYVIIVMALIFCVSSFPLAKKSYQQALLNYDQLVNMQVDEDAEEEEEEKHSSFCFMAIKGTKKAKLDDAEASAIVYELLCDPSIRNVINNKLVKGEDELTDYIGKCSLKVLENSSTILFSSTSLSAEEFAQTLDSVKEVLEKDISDIIGPKIAIEFGDVVSQHWKQELSIESHEERFVSAVVQEPSKQASYIKTMITSGILGILFGIVCVLVIEYISANKKVRLSN